MHVLQGMQSCEPFSACHPAQTPGVQGTGTRASTAVDAAGSNPTSSGTVATRGTITGSSGASITSAGTVIVVSRAEEVWTDWCASSADGLWSLQDVRASSSCPDSSQREARAPDPCANCPCLTSPPVHPTPPQPHTPLPSPHLQTPQSAAAVGFTSGRATGASTLQASTTTQATSPFGTSRSSSTVSAYGAYSAYGSAAGQSITGPGGLFSEALAIAFADGEEGALPARAGLLQEGPLNAAPSLRPSALLPACSPPSRFLRCFLRPWRRLRRLRPQHDCLLHHHCHDE